MVAYPRFEFPDKYGARQTAMGGRLNCRWLRGVGEWNDWLATERANQQNKIPSRASMPTRKAPKAVNPTPATR